MAEQMEQDIQMNFAADAADTAAKRALEIFQSGDRERAKVKVTFTVSQGSHKVEASAKVERESGEIKMTVDSKMEPIPTTANPN